MNAQNKNNVDNFHYMGFQSYGYEFITYISIEQKQFPLKNQVLMITTSKTFTNKLQIPNAKVSLTLMINLAMTALTTLITLNDEEMKILSLANLKQSKQISANMNTVMIPIY